jgi:hypothetical protein
MTKESRDFLEANRWAVESYSEESPPRRMSMKDKARLLSIIQEDINPGFTTDLWCSACEESFILNVYIFYDQFLKHETREREISRQ